MDNSLKIDKTETYINNNQSINLTTEFGDNSTYIRDSVLEAKFNLDRM